MESSALFDKQLCKTYYITKSCSLCCVELWHLVIGVDNKVPRIHVTQSELLD